MEVPPPAGGGGACGRRGDLMISALDSGTNGPGWNPGRGLVWFLGKTLLRVTGPPAPPSGIMVTDKFNTGG